jgi:hypothetical protein
MTKNDCIKRKDLIVCIKKLMSGEYDVILNTEYRGHFISIKPRYENRTEYMKLYVRQNNERINKMKRIAYNERLKNRLCPKCSVDVSNTKYKLCSKHRKK